MIKFHTVLTTPDAYRQSQLYSGEHLAYYAKPTALNNRAPIVTDVENGIFTRYLVKESGLRDMVSTSSSKNKYFIEKRLEHATREELLQRLNYMNGVHYSATNKIYNQIYGKIKAADL